MSSERLILLPDKNGHQHAVEIKPWDGWRGWVGVDVCYGEVETICHRCKLVASSPVIMGFNAPPDEHVAEWVHMIFRNAMAQIPRAYEKYARNKRTVRKWLERQNQK